MKRLINASRDELLDLVRQARGRCIVLNRASMPTGVQPRTARIGVESTIGCIKLHVDRGCVARGLPRAINDWYGAGTVIFGNFESFDRWLQDDLKPCFEARQSRVECTRVRRIQAAIVRISVELGIEIDINSEVTSFIDAIIDVQDLDDDALAAAVKPLISEPLQGVDLSRACSRLALKLVAGAIVGAMI